MAVAANITGIQEDLDAALAVVIALLPTLSAQGNITSSSILSLSLTADLQVAEPAEVLRGGDSSEPDLRLLMPDEKLDRQLKREDEELAIIIAAIEVMKK